MLYFLDITDGKQLVEDPEGTFVATPAKLPDLVTRSVADLLKQFPEKFVPNWSDWKMRVRDAQGAVISETLFSDALAVRRVTGQKRSRQPSVGKPFNRHLFWNVGSCTDPSLSGMQYLPCDLRGRAGNVMGLLSFYCPTTTKTIHTATVTSYENLARSWAAATWTAHIVHASTT